MIIPERSPPLPWSPKTIPSAQDLERFDRALSELEDEDRWINDFIKRLNCVIEEIGHKK
jgi:hypothetical protein